METPLPMVRADKVLRGSAVQACGDGYRVGPETGLFGLMPMTIAIDDLPGLMREWVEWKASLQGLGYSDSTTIWRAMLSQGGGSFGSALPLGLRLLETHGALRRLVAAMKALEDDESARWPVLVTQRFYEDGPERTREVVKVSRAALYNTVKIGEALIKREMVHH